MTDSDPNDRDLAAVQKIEAFFARVRAFQAERYAQDPATHRFAMERADHVTGGACYAFDVDYDTHPAVPVFRDAITWFAFMFTEPEDISQTVDDRAYQEFIVGQCPPGDDEVDFFELTNAVERRAMFALRVASELTDEGAFDGLTMSDRFLLTANRLDALLHADASDPHDPNV